MKEKMADAIGLYYYDYPNVGDALNRTIFETLFDIHATHQPAECADIVAIGSLLDLLLEQGEPVNQTEQEDKRAPIRVWGTGLMFEHSEEEKRLIRPLDICALRGELTRKHFPGGSGERSIVFWRIPDYWRRYWWRLKRKPMKLELSRTI